VAFVMRPEWKEEPVSTTGVLLFDSFLGGADATLAAIASLTSLPVTAVVYSHFHADLVGGSRRLFELLAAGDRFEQHRHLDVAIRVGPAPPDRRPRLAVGRGGVRRKGRSHEPCQSRSPRAGSRRRQPRDGVGPLLGAALRPGYDLALVTTDLTAAPAALITRYAARWAIEQAFSDAR
jgi:glyoxylase-like metal-dependent hydrolase (beta-lactamase superfamily II)